MGEIDFTNIVIDDFRKGKWNPFSKYIYILTHIHTDHLTGLNNSWNYGPIYCSQITANLILNKFNGLKHLIQVIPLEQPCIIKLSDELQATITFFDANHCAGAVIVLLEGYFGRFLYTGDFRFDKNIFSKYSYLYPGQKMNDSFEKCSKQIDKMWLDNTFCNPRFNFPKKEDAFKLVAQFIQDNLGKRIYVGMDNYGKQQALIHLAQKFDTIIVVSQQRYQTIIAMGLDRQNFTTNPQQGLIQVVNKKRFQQKLSDNPDSLGLIMSGWCNVPYWSKDNRIYHVPYSLHSNYKQIVAFVKSIYPSIIEPVVPLEQQVNKGIEQNSISIQQRYSTQGNAAAFRILTKQYTSPISDLYKKNQGDPQFLQALKQKLGLDKKSIQQNQMKAAQLSISKMAPPKGKGYKLQNQRDQEQLQRIKNILRNKKRMNRNQLQQIVISENQQEQEEPQNIVEDDEKIVVNKQIGKKQKKKQKILMKNNKVDMNQFKVVKFLKGQNQYVSHFYQQMKQYLLQIHQLNKTVL